MDGPAADPEWSSTIPSDHLGYVRLGPDMRIFAVAMFHELHCVNIFRKALLNPDSALANEHHVQHCLSYLHQLFLCSADVILEPNDFVQQNHTQESGSVTRECRDWSVLSAHLTENYKEWEDFFEANTTKVLDYNMTGNIVMSHVSSQASRGGSRGGTPLPLLT
jgi:hypothetical protein